ncbi:MAG: hypothetical protein AB7E80_12185 [Hyphomicrobiaceae bacterium]
MLPSLRSGCRRALIASAPLAILLALQPVAAFASPLTDTECDKLESEKSLLEGGGAQANLERGPDWAKINLTTDQVRYIERLIGVKEQLLFRCRSIVVIPEKHKLPVSPDAAPAPERKPETAETAAPGQPPPPAAEVPAPVRKPSASVTTAPAGEAAPEAKSKPVRKAAAARSASGAVEPDSAEPGTEKRARAKKTRKPVNDAPAQ